MKSWEMRYHFDCEPNRIRELFVLTGDTEGSALKYLHDKVRAEHPEVNSVLVHYCIPRRKERYIERHCSHCGSDYQELIREPQTTPPGSREPNNQFRITIERNREWLIL